MARKAKKNNRIERVLWLLVLIVLGGVSLFLSIRYLLQQEQEKKAAEARYTAFGITMPSGYDIHGIDVSSHQRSIAWPEVKAMEVDGTRMGFAFIKASEGLNDADKKFKTNFESAKAAGMICGAYHFFLATKSGKDQAANFIRQAVLQKGDLPPVVDIEQLYGVKPELMRTRLKEWLQAVEAHYGIKPIIYTYADFYNRNLGKKFNDYPLWVAHYLEPEKPRVGREWTFWQHSETGRVNGIITAVDCNVFNGDSTAFRQLLLQ